MPRNIFRVFNPRGTPEDRKEKRRAQLRQAQQTYRERKERYARGLELALAQGRANEAHLLRENQRLQATVEALNEALRQAQAHRVDAHRLHGDGDGDGTAWAPAVVAGESPRGAFLAPPSVDAATTPATMTTETTAATVTPLVLTPQTDGPLLSQSLLHPSTPVGHLDPTDVGMEFVLTIEEPCLGHLHGDPDKPGVPNNHGLTVSAQVCDLQDTAYVRPMALPLALSVPHARSELPDARRPDGRTPLASACETAPKVILASMLALSSALCAPDSGGLTPVQAWHRVRAQPQFAHLALGSLQALAAALRDLATCHGFGAVIEQDTFADEVKRALLGT